MGKSLFEHRCTGHKHEQACSSKHNSTMKLQQLTCSACTLPAKGKKTIEKKRLRFLAIMTGASCGGSPELQQKGIYTACVVADDAMSYNVRC